MNTQEFDWAARMLEHTVNEEEQRFLENLIQDDTVLKGEAKVKFIDMVEEYIGYGYED